MRGPIVPSLGNSWLGMYEIALAKVFALGLMKRNLGGREVTLMDMTDPRREKPYIDPGPLLHSSDIVAANPDLERMSRLAREFGKRFWTCNNITADESFGKCRLLYGQIPAFYGSEAMCLWSWNHYFGDPWNDFDGRGDAGDALPQSDADWAAVYPSVAGVEPVRTLAFEAAAAKIRDAGKSCERKSAAGRKRCFGASCSTTASTRTPSSS